MILSRWGSERRTRGKTNKSRVYVIAAYGTDDVIDWEGLAQATKGSARTVRSERGGARGTRKTLVKAAGRPAKRRSNVRVVPRQGGKTSLNEREAHTVGE